MAVKRLEIGQRVWRYDCNRRKYSLPGEAELYGNIIWREHWEPLTVISETSRSYVIGYSPEYQPYKIAKSYVSIGDGVPGWAFSEEELDQLEWMENSYKISEKVRMLKDYDKLKAIADIVGWKIEDAK